MREEEPEIKKAPLFTQEAEEELEDRYRNLLRALWGGGSSGVPSDYSHLFRERLETEKGSLYAAGVLEMPSDDELDKKNTCKTKKRI